MREILIVTHKIGDQSTRKDIRNQVRYSSIAFSEPDMYKISVSKNRVKNITLLILVGFINMDNNRITYAD